MTLDALVSSPYFLFFAPVGFITVMWLIAAYARRQQ
jgi:hypothetical protein